MSELGGALVAASPLGVLLIALGGAPLTLLLGWRRPRLAALVAVLAAAVSLLAVMLAWGNGDSSASYEWIPSLGAQISLSFDGISAVYGLLATGIGLAVLVYSGTYLPAHLAHHGRPASDATAFYALILLFMGAMVGLVMADDLILLFVFWDLTAIVSYFLIGFDRDEAESRPAALMALLVTGGTAILMLAGIVILWLETGTLSISALTTGSEGGDVLSLAMVLIAVAALAKSAQVPLHFWLPRAMAAPTPVSAYLHSAAMVAAGVFLLARLAALVQRASWLPEALVAIGLGSMVVGGVLALSRDDLKRLLAYSTIGQYGYVVVMLGIGGGAGAVGAGFYVMAHGLAKSALFLTAGAVTEATGARRLSELGGLRRGAPLLAAASGLAAATLAALPLTIGFFKDELFFAAMHEQGAAFTAAAIGAAALTFAYIGRFWAGIFLGGRRPEAATVPVGMLAPIVGLALLCLVGGVWVEPAAVLAAAAGRATLHADISVDLAYHLDARAENLMALAAYALGLAALATARWWSHLALRVAEVAARLGPDVLYRRAIQGINDFSDRLHGFEVHDLRGRIAGVLVPVGVFIIIGFLATPSAGAFEIGTFEGGDVLVALVLVVVAVAAITVTAVAGHLATALVLSAVGFPLAAVFAFLGAPDVALVAVLTETMFSLLFVAFLAALHERPRVEILEREPEPSYRWRDPIISVVTGVTTFLVIWSVLSKPAALESDARGQISLTESAHAGDVVTAILSDFRGLDTMGEITVIGIAMIGLLTLMRRPWRYREPR